MSQIIPYREQIAARGVSENTQNPDTADGGIGVAGRALGQAMAQYAAHQNAVEEDQGKMWAANAAAENEVQQQKLRADRVNSLDPSAPDYVDKINALPDQIDQDYQASVEKLQDQAPNDAARRYLTVHSASGRIRAVQGAIDESANLNAAYAVDQVGKSVKSATDIIAGSPDNGTYQSVVEQHKQAIMGLSTIDPNTKLKLAEGATHQFAIAQVQSVAAQDPQSFLRMVHAQGGTTTSAASGDKKASVDEITAQATKLANLGGPGKNDAAAQSWMLRQMKANGYDVQGDADAAPLYVAGNVPDGMLAPGNIDIAHRPIAHNSDGSISTVRSISISEDGKSILIPTVVDGKVVSNDEAIAHYHKTGENLGVFQNDAQADAYAQGLHEQQAGMYASSDPQVQPLTDGDIAAAKVQLAGWDNLSWPEKVSAVRSAEAQVGKQLAEDRGALSRELQDANAALQDGKPYPGMGSPRFSEANLRRVFGDDQGSRMAQELAYNANVGNFVNKAQVMPAAQRQAMLAQLEPQPGEGYAEKARTYDMAQRAVKQVEAQQQAKPIESAIASGIGGAKPLDFSQPLAPQLRDRTAVASTMVRDYGTKAQIFTDAEVEQIAGSLGNMTGKDRIATLASIRTGLSDPGAFATAMNQLAPKNPNLAYAGNLAARGGTAYVGGKALPVADVAATIADGDIILNGRSLDRQAAKGDDPSMPSGSKALNFPDNQFRTQFNTVLGGAFQSPDAQRSAAVQEETYNAAKAYYVAEAYRQGKNFDAIDPDGVKRAVEAVVGSPWQKNGGTLLAPYGMPVEQFQNQWDDRAKGALKAAGYDDSAVERLLDKTVPINLADGRYGFQNGTRLQTDSRGRPVIVDYRQPYKGG